MSNNNSIEIDTATIGDAGFDKYLIRLFVGSGEGTPIESRYVDASSLVGGTIGEMGILYLGSKQIKLDGKNKRIVISDGVNDRVIIGGF